MPPCAHREGGPEVALGSRGRQAGEVDEQSRGVCSVLLLFLSWLSVPSMVLIARGEEPPQQYRWADLDGGEEVLCVIHCYCHCVPNRKTVQHTSQDREKMLSPPPPLFYACLYLCLCLCHCLSHILFPFPLFLSLAHPPHSTSLSSIWLRYWRISISILRAWFDGLCAGRLVMMTRWHGMAWRCGRRITGETGSRRTSCDTTRRSRFPCRYSTVQSCGQRSVKGCEGMLKPLLVVPSTKVHTKLGEVSLCVKDVLQTLLAARAATCPRYIRL